MPKENTCQHKILNQMQMSSKSESKKNEMSNQTQTERIVNEHLCVLKKTLKRVLEEKIIKVGLKIRKKMKCKRKE